MVWTRQMTAWIQVARDHNRHGHDHNNSVSDIAVFERD